MYNYVVHVPLCVCVCTLNLLLVMTGQNSSITIFLPAGHTKYSPDTCFGFLKQKFRKTDVASLDDIATVVEKSASVNESQLVGNTNGEVIVPTCYWTSYFAAFYQKIDRIKGYFHFEFEAQSPGVVFLRRICDGPVSEVKLWKGRQELIEDELPPVVPQKGLTRERQWYRYDKIRWYCRDECKDLTCPLPDTPRPSSRQSTPGIVEDEDAPELGMKTEVSPSQITSSHQPTKKRQCSICQQYGHN